MTLATCANGANAALYMEPAAAPHTFDGSSERYEFHRESMQKKGRIIGGRGITGTRSKHSARTRVGAYTVDGAVLMDLNPGYLVNLLPRILGGNASGTTFPVAETLQPFGMLIDKVVDTFEYKNCLVDSALIHARNGPEQDGEPELLTLTLNIVAEDRARATSAPSVSIPATGAYDPFISADCVLTLEGAARYFDEWWLYIDNHVYRRYAGGKATPYSICPQDRTVMLRVAVPWDSDHDDLLDAAAAGAAGSIALTNGTVSTTFSFANLQIPPVDPVVPGKTPLSLMLQFIARETDATKEIVVTNDSTP